MGWEGCVGEEVLKESVERKVGNGEYGGGGAWIRGKEEAWGRKKDNG